MNKNRETLMKFISAQNQKVQDDISKQGYKDNSPYRNNPFNIIQGTPQGTSITMKGVSTPLIGMDEYGNKQYMQPGQEYQFPGSQVTETRVAKYGGLLNKTITCSNCGWEWKGADGGSDVMDCHKCGGKGLVKAQEAGQNIIKKNVEEEGIDYFNKVKDWYDSYINSPGYLENLKKSGYKDPQAIIDRRLANISNTGFRHDENRLGTYYNNRANRIHYSPIKDQINFPGDDIDTILAHEGGHSSIDIGDSFLQGFKPNYNKYDFEQLIKRKKKNIKNAADADENYADQKAIQYEAEKQGLYKAGYGEFTEEIFDKLKDSGFKQRALKHYSKEDLIWLLNNIAQNDNNQSQLPVAQWGGRQQNLTSRDSVAHQADKILKYEQLRGSETGSGLSIYEDPKYKDQLMNEIYPRVSQNVPYGSAMEKSEMMDFIFNTGKDPRVFAYQEYLRRTDPNNNTEWKDSEGKWKDRKNIDDATLSKLYNNSIGKLPENKRRQYINLGRDWYYKNTAPKDSAYGDWNLKSQGPHPAYNNTWYGRIWNTNDFSEFNPNNPKFTPKKQMGGAGMMYADRNYQVGGSPMFKSSSIPQADYVEPTYSYPLREKLYPGEDEYFKAHPEVTGMAAEDNQVIINPYSKLTAQQKEGIRMNETARLAMRNGYKRPTFDLTPEQQEFFSTIQDGKPYSEDLQDIRETIIGRILSGDDSAGNVTPEQKKYAEELQRVLKFQVGGQSTYTVSGEPLIIPSQGSYPFNYNNDLPVNEAGMPYITDKDGKKVLLSSAMKVPTKDEFGKQLTRNQIAYNQDRWNDQKEAYSPGQADFNVWKNNAENTQQGFYNRKEYDDMVKKFNKLPNVEQEGKCGVNFSHTECGISKQHAKEDKAAFKKMQEQGGLIKAQTGKQVKYGTPEYTEAYNKGEVITDKGVRSPIALDEVVIQNNYKRPRGFWEQYVDKIVEENKDASVLGAIIGTPISAVTSLPQLAMMKGLTGKMQRPSEGLEIQNPYGKFAVDAVTDPAAWFGASEVAALKTLTRENALAKLANIRNIKTSAAPELTEGLATQGFPNPVKIIDDVVPMNLQPQAIVMGNNAGGWNSLSPLNWLPGYGKKLSSKGELYGYPGESQFFNSSGPIVKKGINPMDPNSPAVGFRKFGNSLQDVIDRQALSPKGSGKFSMGRDQIISEGNWAATGAPDEAYSGVFEATMNPNVIGSKIKQVDMGSTRNGTVYRMTDNNVDIPLSDPGLSFNRRLPFSTRYVKVDKQKLIDGKFQLSTQLPHVQSLVEKYASYAGPLAAAGYIANGSEGAKRNVKWLNKNTIDPIIDYIKPQLNSIQYEDGGLTKYQNAGPVKKPKLGAGKYYTTTGNIVDWGTPEYERAYNRGEVLTEEGGRSEVTVDMGMLDEVVVPNNYKRNFWEKYRDKIIEEGEGSGLLGALFGTPINAITSLPQLSLMYGLTGKVQRPSEAWGFETDEGWFDSSSSFAKHLANFTMDASTDPASWVGIGELTAANRLSKVPQALAKVPQALTKLKNIPTSIGTKLRQGLKTAGPSLESSVDNVNFNIAESAKKWTPEIQNITKKEISHITSPEYLQTRMANTGETKEQVLKNVNEILENINKTSVNSVQRLPSDEGDYMRAFSTGMTPKKGTFFPSLDFNPSVNFSNKGDFYDTTLGVLDQEIKHAFSPVSTGSYSKYKNYPTIDVKIPTDKAYENYLNLPFEQQVRFNKIKDYMEEAHGIKRGTKFTDDDITKLIDDIDKGKFNSRKYSDVLGLLENANPEKASKELLKKVLNKAWGIVPGAIGLGAASQMEEEPVPGMKQGGLAKYQNAGAITSEERKPYMGYPPVNNIWLGNKLTKEGYITSTTKGGNYTSFTGNQRADDWINKQIDTGKFGFDPKTMSTFVLKKPVKGLSKEKQFLGTEAFYNSIAPQGFTTKSQDAQIEKLPEWQQDIINEVNTKRRKAVVRDQWDEVYRNPLWYLPGAIATGGLGLLGLEAAGAAAAPYITGALATQLPGMAAVPGATVGNAITAGFAGHGLANVGPDAVEMYKNPSWSNAGSLGMDILEIAPIAGPAAKTIGEGLSATSKVENAAIDYANPIKDLAATFKNRNKKLITIGAENLDKELLKKITQLESPEGFNRLVAQEAEMLKRDFPGMVDLENKAISNAQTRISELYQTALRGNFNANYLEAKKLNSALTPQKFGIPRNNAFFRPGLGSSNFSDSVIDLSKANSPAELRNNIFAKEFYGIEMPGEIAIGREYAEGMPVYDHEINHLLQNTRNTVLDDMLRKYFNNSQNLLKNFSQKTNKAYNYFRKSKHGVPSKEPSSFLAEARRAMLERGLIKDIYEPITPKKVFDAMKHFKTQPYENPYTGQSYHRIFDFANDSPQTLKFLSDAFNKLHAILPIGLTVGTGAAVLPKEKQGGTVGKQKKALSWLNS